jgi:catechol 2,3-dioxygenase-like lactoylglutathione lyase family enzyme
MRVTRLAWLGTRTKNREEMAQFLGHVLGLPLDHETADESVFVLPGGGKVEVFGPNAPDVQHFTTGPVAGFLVDDVAAAADELRRAGIEILSGPTFADEDIA